MEVLSLNRRIRSLLGAGVDVAIVPDALAQEWLADLAERGGKPTCAHGHPWSIATARVRVRDRRTSGRGISVERDCRICKQTAYALARSRRRHQMKGGRLT